MGALAVLLIVVLLLVLLYACLNRDKIFMDSSLGGGARTETKSPRKSGQFVASQPAQKDSVHISPDVSKGRSQRLKTD